MIVSKCNEAERASRLLVLSVALAISSAATAQEAETPANAVQSDVRQIVHALYSGDIETVLSFTHPTIIQGLGGPEAARAATRQALERISQLGMRVETLSFPRPPEFLSGGGRKFAIVPTLMVVSANGQRFESLNFQLGVLDSPSASWKYVEGSRVSEQNVQSLFPGFPAEYEFPSFYRKKM